MADRIVVLGAGAGGTMVANRLDRELAALGDVVVVDRSPTHRYRPAQYLAPVDVLDIDSHARDVREYLRDDVRFREATVTGIDPGERTVETTAGTVPYDRLVVALGHATDDDRASWAPDAPDVYPYYRPAAARALDAALDDAREGAVDPPVEVVVTTPPDTVSCGGAPVKTALLIEDYLTDEGVACEVRLTTPGSAVFGTGKKRRYERRLRSVIEGRVAHVPEFTVADVADGVVTAADGRTLSYDLCVPTSPQRCPAALTEESPLTSPVEGEAGEYVAVDPATLRHREFDRVYALGDCTDVPASKTAAAARKQAATLADNLTADVADCAREAHYGGFAACPLLTKRGKAILAMYDYESATAPAYSTRLGWVADVHFIPRLYWSVWLRGYLLGV